MKTRKDVQQLMEKIFKQCQEVREDRQKAYAHDESNALANFERTGMDLDIARERVWYIFAKKHWDGVLSWINGNRAQHEDVRGRIMDLIVYLVLFWAMVDDTLDGEVVDREVARENLNDTLEETAITFLLDKGYTIKKGTK